MNGTLKNCWEIMDCGRHFAGSKVQELGECVASREQLGHSCWTVPGTLCDGFAHKSITEQQMRCMSCNVYKQYHRTIGPDGKKIKDYFPEEEQKYRMILLSRMNARQ